MSVKTAFQRMGTAAVLGLVCENLAYSTDIVVFGWLAACCFLVSFGFFVYAANRESVARAARNPQAFGGRTVPNLFGFRNLGDEESETSGEVSRRGVAIIFGLVALWIVFVTFNAITS